MRVPCCTMNVPEQGLFLLLERTTLGFTQGRYRFFYATQGNQGLAFQFQQPGDRLLRAVSTGSSDKQGVGDMQGSVGVSLRESQFAPDPEEPSLWRGPWTLRARERRFQECFGPRVFVSQEVRQGQVRRDIAHPPRGAYVRCEHQPCLECVERRGGVEQRDRETPQDASGPSHSQLMWDLGGKRQCLARTDHRCAKYPKEGQQRTRHTLS